MVSEVATGRSGRYVVDPGLKVLLRDLGASAGEVLTRAALPADLFAQPNASLSPAEYFALYRALEATTKDPLLPLSIVERFSVETFQAPLFAALASEDLHTAAERLSMYKRLIGPMKLGVSLARELTLTLRWLDEHEPPPVGLVITELAFLVRLARLATREPIRATAVTVAADAGLPAAFEAYFGAAPKRGREHTVRFSLEDARRPFLTANASMWAVFEPALRRRLMDLDASAPLAERVRAVLLELLPSGRTSLGDAARRLALSGRTLQRRLAEEGTSYQEVLDRTRHQLAVHYLTRSELTASEISFLLGFADPRSFFRAFHGWTGSTPERLRSQDYKPSRAGAAP